jgi:hypothetical protein
VPSVIWLGLIIGAVIVIASGGRGQTGADGRESRSPSHRIVRARTRSDAGHRRNTCADRSPARGANRVTAQRGSLRAATSASHGAGDPFYHVSESPYEDFDDDFTRLRAFELTLDRSRSTAAWRVDGRRVYEAHGTSIPERARIGFGVWTMLPIGDGRSGSLDGQGMDVRWRGFRVRGVGA